MSKNIDMSKVKEALQHKANPYHLELWLNSILVDNNLSDDNSLYGYIPIRLVALIEDSLRDEYARIIDDKRFRKNLTEVIDKKIPLNVEVLSSLQDDVISMGEYFSYSLSCNGIEDIIKNLGKLLGCNFCEELEKKLGDSKESVFSVISKIFKERNILCHESSIEPDYNKSIIKSYIQSVICFLNIIRDIIQDKLDPNFPQTTVDMLNVAMTEFEVVDKELSETVQTIKDNDKIGIVNEMGSLDFIDKRKSYREERAEFDSRSF